jgi:paraquat-inducible protein A
MHPGKRASKTSAPVVTAPHWRASELPEQRRLQEAPGRIACAPASLAGTYPGSSKQVNALLLSAFALFVIGIFAPLLTFHKLVLFSNTVSLVSALVALVREGHSVLFVVLFGFSVVLPALKLLLLYQAWNRAPRNRNHLHRYLAWLAHYGKWSMLDVFVVAVLLVTLKLKAIASVEVHVGLYAFAGSVLLTMLLTAWLTQLAKQADKARVADNGSAR